MILHEPRHGGTWGYGELGGFYTWTAVGGACSGESAFACVGGDERRGVGAVGGTSMNPAPEACGGRSLPQSGRHCPRGRGLMAKGNRRSRGPEPHLQKRRRDLAYGTALFVAGRLQNSCHTFHMCTSATHCPVLSVPPRLSGCDFITSVVPTRPPPLHSSLPAGPFQPFRPGQLGRTGADWHRGGGDRPRSGRGDAAER